MVYLVFDWFKSETTRDEKIVSWYDFVVYVAPVIYSKERFTRLDRTFHKAGNVSSRKSRICLWIDRSKFEVEYECSGLEGTSLTRKRTPLGPYA